MITATSPSKIARKLAATAVAVLRRWHRRRRRQSMPDIENGRYALSPVADGVIRLDTRTGAVSTCNNSGTGWACYAVPDERAALDAEIGRLQSDNEKLKAQLAAREPTVTGKIDEPLPKTDSLKSRDAEGRGRAQDRNSAAERSRHGPRDVVSGAGLAAADRDGASACRRIFPGRFECRYARSRIRCSRTALIGRRQRQHHRVVACSRSKRPAPALSISPREVAKFVERSRRKEGAVTLFIRHTSASLTIQENADPSVLDDLMTALDRLAPEDAGWTHDTEGPDDMPAHVKTMLTATSLQIPVLNGKLALGTWQAIYLIEHRTRPHRREIVLQFMGGTG